MTEIVIVIHLFCDYIDEESPFCCPDALPDRFYGDQRQKLS
jgi:hypothetical protein